MFSQRLRPGVSAAVTPLARRIPAHPDTLSAVSLGSAGLAAYAFAVGAFGWAAVGIVFCGLFDVLDGAAARARSPGGSRAGAFLDSALDRIADTALYLGLLLYFLSAGAGRAAIIGVFVAASGNNIASYFKARSEVEGVVCNVGLVKRLERLVLLFLAGVWGPGVAPTIVWILALFSLQSLVHRFVFIRHRLPSAHLG